MPDSPTLSEHLSYSEISRSYPWIELNPKAKEDRECNLCGQLLVEVRSRDVGERKVFYLCPGCKVVKQFLEDTSVRIIIE